MTKPIGFDDPNAAGLICAFQLSPFAQRGAEMPAQLSEVAEPLWLHLNLTDSRARRWLAAEASIPDAAREVLLDSEPRILAQRIPEGLVAVLGDLHHDFASDPEGFGELRVFVGANRIITARRHPLQTPDALRRELDAETEVDAALATPLGFFGHLLDTLADTFGSVMSRLSQQVDDTEDRILAGAYRDQRAALGVMRRLLARLRRHLSANRSALLTLPERLTDSCDAGTRRGLREAIDRLEAVGQDLELIQERARLLQEEIAGRLGEATNRNLFVLSVVTTALLPITLLTGIFGMNVGGLPWAQNPHGFQRVMLIIGGAVVTVVVLINRRHLFRT